MGNVGIIYCVAGVIMGLLLLFCAYVQRRKDIRILGLSCIFPVPNINNTAEYYVNELGFSAGAYLNCKEPHICLYLDKVEIILLQSNTERVHPNRELYGYGYDAYLYVEDQDALEKKFASKNVNIVKPLAMTDYQNREFVIEDIDGRWLAFGLKKTTE